MNSQESRGSGRRRGGRRPNRRDRSDAPRAQAQPPAPKTLWQKIVAFFKPAARSSSGSKPASDVSRSTQSYGAERPTRQVRKPEAVEVTSTKLYIGNLSYDATESDLTELFNGVGAVVSAEIVSHKDTHRSKGFGFVTMTTIEEAKRAVTELHDKEFMGRKLVVSGAKTPA
jgi:RNA recognition motif. (a.k.a. RRM, RBD, or RNP domain)